MNTLIQEIAKQTAYVWHASGDPKIYEFTPEKLEKFVELIVKECVGIADEYDGAGSTIVSRIKQRFGVKE